ncbi:MAG: polysaccharide deacetylase family protein [Candidatus Omnitrophica bacterium]|nr:polysaccharide deacetylase family protein [Candidatus Omnitrophota bacterium]
MKAKTFLNILYGLKVHVLARRINFRNAVILSYHRVASSNTFEELYPGMIVTADNFKLQMDFLKKNYQIISLEELISAKDKASFPHNTAVITFDDGYYDNYEFAYPVLNELNLPATIFISTDFIEKGRSFFWDEVAYMVFNTKRSNFQLQLGNERVSFNLELKSQAVTQLCLRMKQLSQMEQEIILDTLSAFLAVPRNRAVSNFLTWSVMKEMQQHKISFGAHTHSHGASSVGGFNEIMSDILKSKEVLDNKLSQNTKIFAYPFGDKTDIALDVSQGLAKYGFKCAVTLEAGLVKIQDDPFLWKRVGIGGHDDRVRFALKTSGVLPLLSKFKAKMQGC